MRFDDYPPAVKVVAMRLVQDMTVAWLAGLAIGVCLGVYMPQEWRVALTADGDNCAVCTANDLGETPGQIQDQLHQGDPRISWDKAAQRVWSDLENRNDD